MAFIILFFVSIDLLGPTVKSMATEVLSQIKFRTGQLNTFTINGIDFIIEERTTLVRIQEPKPLLMGLRVGGKMRGMGWKDVDIAKYETAPNKALEQAVDDYDGYRIAAYQEIDPDGKTPEDYNYETEVSETGWIEVNPERDLPDE